MTAIRRLILSRSFQLLLRFAVYGLLMRSGWGAAHAAEWTEPGVEFGTAALLTVVDMLIHERRETHRHAAGDSRRIIHKGA
jgi:hypothetical protein